MKRIIRWTSRRKAELLHSIEIGEIKEDEACDFYLLSHEEIQSWRSHISKFGLKGLRSTKTCDYRRLEQ